MEDVLSLIADRCWVTVPNEDYPPYFVSAFNVNPFAELSVRYHREYRRRPVFARATHLQVEW